MPIETRSVAEDVVDRLVTAVALGLYVEGQQLPTERELASLLNVSRTTVREALKHLTQTGYLEVRRGRSGGYFVRANWGPKSAEHVRRQLVDNWDRFQEILDARILTERMIASTAASRRTNKDITAIREAEKAYAAASGHDESRLADGNLHLVIARATQNEVLVEMSVDFRAKISLNLGAEPYTDEARQRAIGHHRELVEAITAGAQDEAADIAARHFALSEDLIRSLVERAVHDDADKDGGVIE